MLDLLAREIDLLVGRLRGFTPARYAATAPPFPARADVVRHLAQRLVDLAGIGRSLPDLPATALADVVAVTGQDLVRSDPSPDVIREALGEVVLHRYDVDGARPGPRTAATAGTADPEALLADARRRCPAYA